MASEPGHIKLLAVSGEGENQTGSVADLYLEVKPGSGRVFIDTYPLTKLDTQFSTRFAKSVACDYLDIDCSRFDFFYTIKSDSSIVGGPSAGAAVTILTISKLSGRDMPYDVAMTGTINSGGIIGPVGGLRVKVDAAEGYGLKIAVVPALSLDNSTELEKFLNQTRIDVRTVSTIDEAMHELLGIEVPKINEIIVDPVFTKTMKVLSKTLCEKTENLLINASNSSYAESGKKLYEKGLNATLDEEFYSAASYCFGANVELQKLYMKNKTQEELLDTLINLSKEINALNLIVGSIELNTMSDLQAYMIVKERLKESNEYVVNAREENFINISSDDLAYSLERYYSAITWSKFFGTGKKEYALDKESLKKVCKDKISEVVGFHQYVASILPIPLEGIGRGIEYAQTDLENREFELCIFKASKAKAQISLILESISISREQIQKLLDQKFEIARKTISKVQDKGVFPILGYSYYEYANSLRENDPDSALLYISYANELSALNVYFEQKKNDYAIKVDKRLLYAFILGLLMGIIVTLYFFPYILKKKR